MAHLVASVSCLSRVQSKKSADADLIWPNVFFLSTIADKTFPQGIQLRLGHAPVETK